MKTISRSDALARFRTLESLESALILLGKSKDAVKLRAVALAWPRVPLILPIPKHPIPDDAELWDHLWDGITIDYDQLAAIAGFPCWPQVQTLRAHQLIYPDGSLSQVAVKTLRQLTKNELGL